MDSSELTPTKIHFFVVTLFPEMIEGALQFGVVGQAQKNQLIDVQTINPRQFTTNVHQTVDDRPFGGGDGMVMLGDPLKSSLEFIRSQLSNGDAPRVIHFSPRGQLLTDQKAREFSHSENIILISSRYGGVDQRFLNQYVDEEISIGDYVVSGGELPALVFIDSISRQVPGVLGNTDSAQEESFCHGWLEQPQYTRPREWQGEIIPSTLLSGDHAKIKQWKRIVSLLVTLDRRSDLIQRNIPSQNDLKAGLNLLKLLSDDEIRLLGLSSREELKLKLHQNFPFLS